MSIRRLDLNVRGYTCSMLEGKSEMIRKFFVKPKFEVKLNQL